MYTLSGIRIYTPNGERIEEEEEEGALGEWGKYVGIFSETKHDFDALCCVLAVTPTQFNVNGNST